MHLDLNAKKQVLSVDGYFRQASILRSSISAGKVFRISLILKFFKEKP
jgi:hypothetical protein